MAGVDSEATFTGRHRCFDKWRYRPFWVGGIAVGIRFGVELDAVGACSGGGTHLLHIGVDKYRRSHAGFLEALHQAGEEFGVVCNLPSCARGQGVGGIGHKSHLRRTHLEHKVDKLLGRIPFDIELAFKLRTQLVHIAAAYMAFVLPWMHSDAVGTVTLDVERDSFNIGAVLAACVA